MTVATIAMDDTDTAIIQAVRYEPATGWSAPTTIFRTLPNSGSSMNNLYVVADAQGDAIVAADDYNYGAVYVVYSQSQKAWQAFQPFTLPISPITGDPTANGIALSVSPNRQHIQFSYASAPAPQPAVGLFTNAFDPATLTFGSPVLVPTTAHRAGYYLNHEDKIIASVDNTGAINIVWPRDYGTYASRYEHGHWKRRSASTLGHWLSMPSRRNRRMRRETFWSAPPAVDGETYVGSLQVLKFSWSAPAGH